MRSFAQLALLTALLAASPVLAQQWLDYVNRDYRFSINFPAEPRQEADRYTSASGVVLAATRFVAEKDLGHYAVTVIDFLGADFDVNSEMEHAVALLGARGTIRYEGATDYDDIPVYELNMVAADGNQLMATAILFEQYLYLVEAEVSAEMPPPIHFMQSVSPLGANGRAVLQ